MAHSFALVTFYPNTSVYHRIESAEEETLRVFGKDHHKNIALKPTIHLLDHDGKLIAYMDEWSTDWNENNCPEDESGKITSWQQPKSEPTDAEQSQV